MFSWISITIILDNFQNSKIRTKLFGTLPYTCETFYSEDVQFLAEVLRQCLVVSSCDQSLYLIVALIHPESH